MGVPVAYVQSAHRQSVPCCVRIVITYYPVHGGSSPTVQLGGIRSP